MENNTVYVNTVFFSDNVFRPFLTTDSHAKWTTNKIAFYRSLGQSIGHNEYEENYRKNVWFPVLSILEKKTVLYDELSIYQEGYIVKASHLSTLFKTPYKWYWILLKHMKYSPIQTNPQWSILAFLKREVIDDNVIYLIMDIIRKCIIAISGYCNFWWQVQISARLGGGLWEIVPIFRKYVLSYDFDDYSSNKYITFHKRETPLDELKIVFNVPENTKNTIEEVNISLKNECALMELLIYQDFRPYKKQLKRIFNYGAKSKMQILELKNNAKTKYKKPKSKKSTRKRV